MEKSREIEILHRLKNIHPKPKTALKHSSPLEMLVATILSAQCTDARVNIVTEKLFKIYRSVKDFARADFDELAQIIKPAGFFRNKARSIIGAAAMIESRFGGKVPDKMEDILKLPGVARKTANVVLSESYGVIEGIAVDTHVKRLSKRLGFSENGTPEKIETDLMALFPKDMWYDVCNLLIFHGRNTCVARKPRCEACILNDLCPSAFKI